MIDWDVAQIRNLLVENNLEFEDCSDINPVYQGIRFNILGIKIQIICATTSIEFSAWEYATSKMKATIVFNNREERILQFRRYYDSYIEGII